jgi:uncharacterized DUF497 family protein
MLKGCLLYFKMKYFFTFFEKLIKYHESKRWYNMKIEFEYDHNKSQSNKHKHGIDFEEAKALFDEDMVALSVNHITDEVRYMAINKLDTKYFTVIYTYRHSKIRLISTRRSRKNEEKTYEEYHCKRV